MLEIRKMWLYLLKYVLEASSGTLAGDKITFTKSAKNNIENPQYWLYLPKYVLETSSGYSSREFRLNH